MSDYDLESEITPPAFETKLEWETFEEYVAWCYENGYYWAFDKEQGWNPDKQIYETPFKF